MASTEIRAFLLQLMLQMELPHLFQSVLLLQQSDPLRHRRRPDPRQRIIAMDLNDCFGLGSRD